MQTSESSKSLRRNELFPTALGDVVNVFSALSNEDSLRIFYVAKDGVESSTKVIQELELTQKKYYTRLKELLEAGLIQKDYNGYQHTSLGKMCYKLFQIFMEVLSHNEQLELIDKVRHSTSLSLREKEEVVRSLSRSNSASLADLLGGSIEPVRIATTFEDVASEIKRLLEKAEKQVYLATRFTDPTVTETVVNSLDRGVEMYLLDGDKKNLSEKVQLLRFISSQPRMIRLFYEIFRSSKVYTGYTSDLLFSFIVVDGKYVGIEIPRPDSDAFLVGLFFENELLSQKLIEVFNLLMKDAKEDPKKEFSEKIYAQFPRKILKNELLIQK